MPINSPEEIHSRLLELAEEREFVETSLKYFKEQRDKFIGLIKQYEDRLEATERSVRDDILTYIQETGDLRCHPSVTFRRTQKLVYDREQVLGYARTSHPELVRVKEELDVRAFEKAWKNGELPDVQAEMVNAPTLEIGKLGDLLIVEESKDEN
jgi:hypothetical protein